MRVQFSTEQFDAVIAVAIAARQIATTGEVPTLSNGWRIGTPSEAGFYNDTQRRTYVPLGHEDANVLRAARTTLSEMGMIPMVLGLNATGFIFVKKPDNAT